MSFVARLKGLFGITWGIPGANTWQGARDWELAVFPMAGKGRLTQPYAQNPVIFTALRSIARDASSVEWEMFGPEPGAEKPIPGHPALVALEKANARAPGSRLFFETYLDRSVFGEAFWYYPDLVIPKAGVNARFQRMAKGGIELLSPPSVEHMVDEKAGTVTWRQKLPGNRYRPLNADRLTQFREPNPYDPVRGLSLLTPLMVEMAGDHASATWNCAYFEGGGIPAGLLKPSATAGVTSDQRAEILRTWQQRHGQLDRRVGMLYPGWDFQDISAAQKDMDFRALRSYARELQLGVAGVPPMLAGVLENANYANARVQDQNYWRHTIQPLVDDTANLLNAEFFPRLGVEDVLYPKWEAVVALLEDMEAKSQVAVRFWQMGVPFEQINDRLELGFNPDNIPGSDEGYLPVNMVPVEMLGAEPVAGAPASGGNTPAVTLPAAGPEKGGRELKRSVAWRNLATRTIDLEVGMNRVFRRHFESLRAEALSHLTGIKGWRIRHVKAPPPDFYLFDVEAADRTIQKVTRPVYEAAVRRGGEGVLAEVGLGGSFSVDNPTAVALVGRLVGKIRGINDTLARELQASLREGAAAGETEDGLAARVRDVFANAQNRSRTIARTEVGTGFNGGRVEAMKQAGIERHEWLSARDSDVRDSHQAVDGEVVPVGTSFSNGLLYPNDPAGPADEVINCRCVALAVIEPAA